MTFLYELEGVRQRRDGRLVLDVPALRIRPGRVHALVGPNGSGKTTLLAILGLLAPPAAGSVRLDGERVEWRGASLLARRRQITLVHQSPYLFAGTVEENLAIGLGHRRLDRDALRARVADALAAVGLSAYAPRAARALSQGEAQRVAVARAVLLEPRVLLLDEPLANLDRRSTLVLEELIAAQAAAGRTVVMSSHDPAHPARFGAEVIALRDGALVEPAAAARLAPSQVRDMSQAVTASVTPRAPWNARNPAQTRGAERTGPNCRSLAWGLLSARSHPPLPQSAPPADDTENTRWHSLTACTASTSPTSPSWASARPSRPAPRRRRSAPRRRSS